MRKKKRNGFTLIEGAVCLAIMNILAMVAITIFLNSKEKETRVNCYNNVRMLSVASQLYAADHKEVFPSDGTIAGWAKKLYPAYIKNSNMFLCPGTKTAPSTLVIGETCDYGFISGLKESDPADSIMICDKPKWTFKELGRIYFSKESNHRSDGGNFGFVDGHISWIPTNGTGPGRNQRYINSDSPNFKETSFTANSIIID